MEEVLSFSEESTEALRYSLIHAQDLLWEASKAPSAPGPLQHGCSSGTRLCLHLGFCRFNLSSNANYMQAEACGEVTADRERGR